MKHTKIQTIKMTEDQFNSLKEIKTTKIKELREKLNELESEIDKLVQQFFKENGYCEIQIDVINKYYTDPFIEGKKIISSETKVNINI